MAIIAAVAMATNMANEKMPVIHPMRAPPRIVRRCPVLRSYHSVATKPARKNPTTSRNTGNNNGPGNRKNIIARPETIKLMRTAVPLRKLISAAGGAVTGSGRGSGGGS
jgi:hypothetical protein